MASESSFNVESYIDTYDLSFIHQHLKSKKWRANEIEKACLWYKRYILLRHKHSETAFPPTREIDLVWKAHIVHTKDYRQFCNTIFDSGYLDRTYDTDLNWDQKNLQKEFKQVTQTLFLKEFGSQAPLFINFGFWAKLYRNIRQLWAKWLTATVLVTIMGTAFSIISAHNTQLNNKYQQLKTSIRNISYDEEETYLICNSNVEQKHPRFFIEAIYDSHLKRRQHLAKFLDISLNLRQEKTLTAEADKELSLFSRRTNELYKGALNVCKLPLQNLKEIDQAREELTNFVWKSREKFLWPFGSWI